MATAVRPPIGDAGQADPTPFLLRLYPAAWRARYGDEFTELLLARPPGLRDSLDIVASAVDARVHPQLDPNAAPEASLPGDRSLRAMLVLAGVFLTLWAGIGFSQVGRWGSGPAEPGQQTLLNIAWVSGLIGSLLIGAALFRMVSSYDETVGGSGALGAVLTGFGLLFSAFGSGWLGLVMLGLGTALLAWRLRGRLLGTVPALLLAATTTLLIGCMVLFVASNGQNVGVLSAMIAYGPAWMVVGLTLRSPALRAVGA